MDNYDAIVIGGGLSGMGAALRLALCGRRVLLLERHFRLGGMNSWYERGGFTLDTGLHALTNYATEGDSKAILNQVLRQLRIRRNTLGLCPQRQSRIVFPGSELLLNNDYEAFCGQVKEQFPQDAAGFETLSEKLFREGYASEAKEWRSANGVLEEHLSSERLRDLLRFPVMYYGNATAEDMDFGAFATMYRSVFMEGFSRPQGGMKQFLGTLEERLKSAEAEIRLGTGVKELLFDDNGAVHGVLTDRGEEIAAPNVISTIGAFETARLCGEDASTSLRQAPAGDIGFLEAIFTLPKAPTEYGWNDAILFACRTDIFRFAPPKGDDIESMLVCAPGNYVGTTGDEERMIRLSTIVRPNDWLDIASEDYKAKKNALAERLRECLRDYSPAMAKNLTLLDAFTPKTIRRWTGHANGAIYGSPQKFGGFDCGVQGLQLAGTDQGLLGITGAMLSGIIAANRIRG